MVSLYRQTYNDEVNFQLFENFERERYYANRIVVRSIEHLKQTSVCVCAKVQGLIRFVAKFMGYVHLLVGTGGRRSVCTRTDRLSRRASGKQCSLAFKWHLYGKQK